MKRNTSIQITAGLLLIVFSMNTFIGFACAMGLNMDFNRKHPHETEGTAIHRICHENNMCCHRYDAENDRHKSTGDKENCCNDNVMKFAKIDKLLTQFSRFTVDPGFFIIFFSAYYNMDALPVTQVAKSTKYFVRSHHPPISDIRIAIQSFQV